LAGVVLKKLARGLAARGAAARGAAVGLAVVRARRRARAAIFLGCVASAAARRRKTNEYFPPAA
jgi:hypothetical protein